MHEMALVKDVVEVVNRYAAEAQVEEVVRVRLAIGYARDIVEPLFEDLFRYLARGTVAENAELELRRIPLTIKCNVCGTVFPRKVRDKSALVCPHCHDDAHYQLKSGMEFIIESIEVGVSQPNAEPALLAG